MKSPSPKQTKKKVKETPTEKYLREIVELLKQQSSQPIFPPFNPPQYQNPNIIYANMTWCEYCRVYNCGKMHVTC